jgi:hypothetical protein
MRTMLLEVLLNLRNGRERVSVIHRVGHRLPELGTAHPQEDTRRASIPGHWGTIDEPLPVRTQTILSYRVPPEVRRAINGDITDALPASRRHGIAVDLKL